MSLILPQQINHYIQKKNLISKVKRFIQSFPNDLNNITGGNSQLFIHRLNELEPHQLEQLIINELLLKSNEEIMKELSDLQNVWTKETQSLFFRKNNIPYNEKKLNYIICIVYLYKTYTFEK